MIALRRTLALLLTGALVLGACSGNGGEEAEPAPRATDETEEEEEAFPVAAEDAELCELAQQMFEQEELPSAEQMSRYAELAPEEIAAEAELATQALVPVADDPVAFVATFARDDVEEAIYALDAWELEHCGIDHEDVALPGTSFELDPEAARVDVEAVEFDFNHGEIAAGRTSFVLTNAGQQAHHLVIISLPEGMSAEEALESEEEEEDNGTGEVAFTRASAPGGEDEEVVTVDLEAGNYGFFCFFPAADGTPHAFVGMAKNVTVG